MLEVLVSKMKKNCYYLLDVIDQLTFDQKTNYHMLDEGSNWVKITSRDLELATGFGKVAVRVLLSQLKSMKLITNNPKWSGANSGWYCTTKGHQVARYARQ